MKFSNLGILVVIGHWPADIVLEKSIDSHMSCDQSLRSHIKAWTLLAGSKWSL